MTLTDLTKATKTGTLIEISGLDVGYVRHRAVRP